MRSDDRLFTIQHSQMSADSRTAAALTLADKVIQPTPPTNRHHTKQTQEKRLETDISSNFGDVLLLGKSHLRFDSNNSVGRGYSL